MRHSARKPRVVLHAPAMAAKSNASWAHPDMRRSVRSSWTSWDGVELEVGDTSEVNSVKESQGRLRGRCGAGGEV